MEYDRRCLAFPIAAGARAYTPSLSASVILWRYEARGPVGDGRH